MHYCAKIVLAKSDYNFFGPGVRDLLLNIESEGSVKAACEKMGMSYSKAWKMIRTVEKALSTEVVTRVQGGKSGGSASLTEAGKEMLKRYMRFEQRCNQAISEIYEQEFNQ